MMKQQDFKNDRKPQLKSLGHVVLEMSLRSDTAKNAVQFYEHEHWVRWNWQEYFEQIQSFGVSLIELGIDKGERVALYSNTRVEWSVCDWAILGLGAVTIPIYQTVTTDDLCHILNNSASEVLIVENRKLYKAFQTVQPRCPSVKKIICIEELEEKIDGLLSYKDLLENGRMIESAKQKDFRTRCGSLKSEDIATILYTSGTTGLPKGVVLTHEQAISEVSETLPFVGINAQDTSLSFLPYAHILGRIEHWGHGYIGFELCFARSIELLRGDLRKIKPTILVAVPRIFEKVYSAIYSQMENHPLKAKLFTWAVQVGREVGLHRLRRQALPLQLMAEYKLAQRLALNKVRDAFGGRLRFAFSGGAPLARDISEFFHGCDILILEGYGLTETTAAITANSSYDYRFGSVGKPIGEVQLKIADDGEILVKSKKVMREYLNDQAATDAVFTDGWFHTGDIGEVLPSGDLKITDRKKDLIKTAGGKYVAPQKLENLLKMDPLVANVLIHGDQKKYIVALVSLDKQLVLQIAKEKAIKYDDYSSLTQNPQILESVRKSVARTNATLSSFETIKRFTVVPQEFTVEGGELTPSLKVKRKVLDQRYKQQLEALYR